MSKNLKLGEDICQPVCQTDGPQFLSADPPLRIKADDAPKCFLKVSFPFFFFLAKFSGLLLGPRSGQPFPRVSRLKFLRFDSPKFQLYVKGG